jgi:hypothetical protein
LACGKREIESETGARKRERGKSERKERGGKEIPTERERETQQNTAREHERE